MTTTTGRKSRISAPIRNLKAVEGGEPGVYEGVVAVFGNVDHGGDRIIAGAFGKSLDEWAASGDPIPVIFSHQWDSLDAHVGVVLEAAELMPGSGDARLKGTGLEELGGLWTKFALDIEEDFAGRLAKRLDRRSIREFSFAYDVFDEKRATDGAMDLIELGVIEVGPTLKGMNGLTRLLSDSLDTARPEVERKFAATEFAAEVVEILELADVDDLPGRLGKSITEAGLRVADEKARVTVDFAGSVEERQAVLRELANDWAEDGDIGNGGYYYAHLEATFDDRVIVLVEGWSDPMGEGIFYEMSIGEADGELTLEDPHELEVEVALSAKTRAAHRKAHARVSAKAARAGGSVPDVDEDTGPGGRTDPGGRKSRRQDGPGGSATTSTALVELDLLELET